MSIPFYFVQGVDRGILQGQTRFTPLTITYQTEMWVRLLLGCGLVLLGFSVNGAVAALTLSIIATWAYARYAVRKQASSNAMHPIYTSSEPSLPIADSSKNAVGQQLPTQTTNPTLFSADDRKQIATFAMPVLIGLLGQILINNGDVLIVKHFFDAHTAGGYAALALIGRIVFFATWSIVTALFPIVAQRHQRGEPHRHLLAAALGLVGGASGLIVLATVAFPATIVQILFDSAYLGIAPLLWLYAIATALYALANVIISYRLSINNGFGSILALVAGIAQTIGLWVAHTTLQEIVLVQVLTMGSLLLVLLIWDASLIFQQRKAIVITQPPTIDHQPSVAEPAITSQQ
ncbi:MAG: oligosaccharide flippase family protein [Roseiflexaceae bacterium]|nr:oligosaccharide flippase family protein [Roseiflexaceae bacterium]